MAITKLRGLQVRDLTLKNNHIANDAAIVTTKLAEGLKFIKSDGLVAFAADQSMGGFKLTNLAEPVADTDAATKGYVDALAMGLDVKRSVKVATTGPITLSGVQTVDGILLAAGDRVLVKDQADLKTNGIYVVDTGAWVRAADFDGTPAGEVTDGAFTFVEQGATFQDKGFVLISNDPITLGTSDLTFTQFSGAGQIEAGDGLSKTGERLDVNVGNGIQITSDAVALKLNATFSGLSVDGDGLRLAAAVAGQTLVADASGDLRAVELSGDISNVSDAGVVTISANLMRDTNFVWREAPAGSIDDSNKIFTVANTPTPGTECVYLNGQLLDPGAGNDYTISGTSITFDSAPTPGDKIRVSYMKA